MLSKKRGIIVLLSAMIMALSGCGSTTTQQSDDIGTSSTGTSEENTTQEDVAVSTTEETSATSTSSLTGSCVINFPNRSMITQAMLEEKIIYDSYTASNLDSYFYKYIFNTNGTITREQIIGKLREIGYGEKTIHDDSYEIIDGAVLITRDEGETFLFGLDRVEANGTWTTLRQVVQNNVCADTATPTEWSSSKPVYFPAEL